MEIKAILWESEQGDQIKFWKYLHAEKRQQKCISIRIFMANKGEEGTEIERRIIKANKCAVALNHLIRAINCTQKVKLKLYKRVIRFIWIRNKKY